MFVKSSRPTYKRRVKKAQEGIKFATYTPVEVNQTDYRDLTSIDNPFNEFNFATTYDKPTALVVPETTETKNEVETKSEPVVVNNPTPPVVVNNPTQNVSTSTTWRSPYKDKAKWTKDLSDAYRRVGITNGNAIRMLLAQDALESGWGKSAQGKYNFGNLTTGSSWKGNYVVGNDKNAKGEAIKQKFRAYESMDDYAKDKIQFLKRLYDFDENDDINKFVAKLTGSNKGKRRYAENVKYANLLTNVYNSFKDGGVIRYDGGGVAKRDAITNYRPEIPTRIRKATPAEYIKSVVNIYGQNQSQVSPDSRSKWQHEQASKQADKGYTDYMEAKKTEQGLDRLNQFLTFTDVAGLATGVGSLATKGISYAGKRLVKKGMKKAIVQPSHSKLTIFEKHGVPKSERNQPIKSELDWKNWSKGGSISKEHLAEYNQIEKKAKFEGNWLLTEDGRAWEGDPRTWVQLMSKDGSRFKKGEYPSNSDLYYHGLDTNNNLDPERMQEMYLANDFNRARTYTNTSQPASPESKGGVLHLGIPNTTNTLEVDAKNASWHKITSPFTGKQMSTDEIKNQAYSKGYDAVTFDNVLDNGAYWVSGVNPFAPTREIVINKTVPRKSLIWNNGDFNINNPNIYKVLAPFLLIGGTEL